ncbi:hypothetical protein [Chachezhania antarctica]|uniref:hypothetical protein n=1 Tax=Chachezhania antarctica TaxID=2340860 RepID=UPI000EB1AEDE|nr:hypothetical protein [Chachezhania antarctica]|tara:strand:- start:6028 stop:9741 length:3714 start_codon:yes stop_codon:yes gene_type:complete
MPTGITSTTVEKIASADDLLGHRDGSLGRIPMSDLGMALAGSGPVAARFDEVEGKITGGLLNKATWTDLLTLTPTEDGKGGEVLLDDAGTHSDATATGYDGATVPNAGRYAWVEAWGRWQHIGDGGSAAVASDLADHIVNDENPHGITATQLGLADVDNTSDADKPVSTAQQAALNLKANSADLSDVATSGDYEDLKNTPDLAGKADLADLQNEYLRAVTAEETLGGRIHDEAEKIAALSAVVSTKAAHAALLAETSRAAAAEAALGARIDVETFNMEWRPGDNPNAYAHSVLGGGLAKEALDAAKVQVVDGLGRCFVADGADVVALRSPIAVSEDILELTARILRVSNPGDPNNHAVQLRVAWLNKNKDLISDQVINTESSLLNSNGMVEMSVRISAMDVSGVTAPPAGTVYVCPYVKTYGEDGTTAIAVLSVRDVSDTHLVNPTDLTDLLNDLNDARDEAETAAALVNRETLEARGDVASWTPAEGTGVITVQGGNSRGDGLGGEWWLDEDDAVSAADGYDVLVDSVGNRWKRITSRNVAKMPSMAVASAALSLEKDMSFETEGRLWDVVPAATHTENGGTVLDHDTLAIQMVLGTNQPLRDVDEFLGDTRALPVDTPLSVRQRPFTVKDTDDTDAAAHLLGSVLNVRPLTAASVNRFRAPNPEALVVDDFRSYGDASTHDTEAFIRAAAFLREHGGSLVGASRAYDILFDQALTNDPWGQAAVAFTWFGNILRPVDIDFKGCYFDIQGTGSGRIDMPGATGRQLGHGGGIGEYGAAFRFWHFGNTPNSARVKVSNMHLVMSEVEDFISGILFDDFGSCVAENVNVNQFASADNGLIFGCEFRNCEAWSERIAAFNIRTNGGAGTYRMRVASDHVYPQDCVDPNGEAHDAGDALGGTSSFARVDFRSAFCGGNKYSGCPYSFMPAGYESHHAGHSNGGNIATMCAVYTLGGSVISYVTGEQGRTAVEGDCEISHTAAGLFTTITITSPGDEFDAVSHWGFGSQIELVLPDGTLLRTHITDTISETEVIVGDDLSQFIPSLEDPEDTQAATFHVWGCTAVQYYGNANNGEVHRAAQGSETDDRQVDRQQSNRTGLEMTTRFRNGVRAPLFGLDDLAATANTPFIESNNGLTAFLPEVVFDGSLTDGAAVLVVPIALLKDLPGIGNALFELWVKSDDGSIVDRATIGTDGNGSGIDFVQISLVGGNPGTFSKSGTGISYTNTSGITQTGQATLYRIR